MLFLFFIQKYDIVLIYFFSGPRTPNSAKTRSYFNGGTPASVSAAGHLSRLSSVSMSSLASQYAPDTQMHKRISDMRDRLRKSTENLALNPADPNQVANGRSRSQSPSVMLNGSAGVSRSRSIGNLLTPQSQQSQKVANHKLSIPAAAAPDISSLAQSRSITKSLSSLTGAAGGRTLADTIQDIKRLSR